MTGPKNFDRRKAIRETWLKHQFDDVQSYFVIGTESLDGSLMEKLEEEYHSHDDIVFLADHVDSYSKLTAKLIKALKYAKQSYSFLVKCDDDSFINLAVLRQEALTKPRERLYWGFFQGAARVKKTGPWVEPNWVICDRYLPYARGGGYVLSSDLVDYITVNADLLQLFNSEDVSVGAWLAPLSIKRDHDTRFDTEYRSRGCSNQYIITHKQSIADLRQKHHNLISNGVLCEREEQLHQSYVYNWNVLPSNCCAPEDGIP